MAFWFAASGLLYCALQCFWKADLRSCSAMRGVCTCSPHPPTLLASLSLAALFGHPVTRYNHPLSSVNLRPWVWKPPCSPARRSLPERVEGDLGGPDANKRASPRREPTDWDWLAKECNESYRLSILSGQGATSSLTHDTFSKPHFSKVGWADKAQLATPMSRANGLSAGIRDNAVGPS